MSRIAMPAKSEFISSSSSVLDEETLPKAIGHLLEINNHSVEYKTRISGAEVDVIATPLTDPYQSTIYIEATIQYVDNTKYGKDLTKFSLIRERNPEAICISVSTKGFTADVKERAAATRIRTETYDSLFRRFEKFSPYIDHIANNTAIKNVVDDYEPPTLRDAVGIDDAISWFNRWRVEPAGSNWVVLLGEYGTGKTALTHYLQNIWLADYSKDPSNPIPVRIELRNFARQFDSSSLLHHFLDTNSLSHIPLEFVRHLIRSGRIILILDGYDEMAQYMNSRERRACLAALAELAGDGAIGLLTSRPNYFTETEELGVFDALYASLDRNKYIIGSVDRQVIDEEKRVDRLLQSYVLSRRERYLRDLDVEQTRRLVDRKLSDDPDGRKLVLEILERVFRDEVDGHRQSLSGKPVIVTFLLELIDELKSEGADVSDITLSEWDVYRMIVDRLMFRDFARSPTIVPDQRRSALRKLATVLSHRGAAFANESDMFSVIDDEFKSLLRRYQGEEKRTRRDELFQDLRSSATLTRLETGDAGKDAWQFSHNSLREYLVSEYFVDTIQGDGLIRNPPGITDAMRTFATAMDVKLQNILLQKLQSNWPHRDPTSMQSFLSFLWDAMRRRNEGLSKAISEISGSPSENVIDLSQMAFDRILFERRDFTGDNARIIARNSAFSQSSFKGLQLSGSSFEGSFLDAVYFQNCDLEGVSFQSAVFFECSFRDVNFSGADMRGLESGSNFMVWKGDDEYEALSDEAAIGFLKFHGAVTDPVPDFYVAQHHPKFPIVLKICENISDQKRSQLRGLTQRGAAHADPGFSREFVRFMVGEGLITINNHDLVSATAKGRGVILRLIDHDELFDGLGMFLGISDIFSE